MKEEVELKNKDKDNRLCEKFTHSNQSMKSKSMQHCNRLIKSCFHRELDCFLIIALNNNNAVKQTGEMRTSHVLSGENLAHRI